MSISIQARGTSWQATVFHQGQRLRKSFRGQLEAQAWAEATEAAAIRGDAPEAPEGRGEDNRPRTLGALLQHTYNKAWAGRGGEKTALHNGKAIVDLLGPLKLAKSVTTYDIDRVVMSLQGQGNSNATINRKLAALSKILTEAKRMGVIDNKPHIERRKEQVNRIRTFSADEEKAMIAYFRHLGRDDMADFCIVALDTGMRLSEVCRLSSADVHGGRISVWVNKANRPRHIPTTSRVKAIVEGREGRIFPKLTKDVVHHYWLRMRTALGHEADKQFVVHTMRHTFCSRLASRGVDARTIMELAGHSTLTVTQRYMHAYAPVVEDAIRKLEEAA
jgi:integrase